MQGVLPAMLMMEDMRIALQFSRMIRALNHINRPLYSTVLGRYSEYIGFSSAMPPMIAPPQLSAFSKSNHSWVVPPLDGSLTISQILHFNYVNNPNEPLFVYTNADDSLQHISWHSAVSAAFNVAAMLLKLQVPKNSVVAIFAKMDFATYWAYAYGILLAGYQPFPISPRNSAPIVAHLLKATCASFIITDANGALQNLAITALDNLQEPLSNSITALTAQPFEKIFNNDNEIVSDSTFMQSLVFSTPTDLNSRALILHSSGSSSAFPKPIYLTHRILIQHAQAPWYGDLDMCGQVVGAAPLVLFHVMGFLFSAKSASMGSVLAILSPNAPSMLPTPDSVMECCMRTSAEYVACVPSYLEKWAEEPIYIDALKKMKAVMYGGGALHRPVGNMLAQQGVTLINLYGVTELGTVCEIICHPSSKENWEYFRISKMIDPIYEAQSDGTKTVELYILPNMLHTPAILDSQINGRDCYRTNDLLESHPKIDGLWRICGRADSQIMLSTGEKTNPGPIEEIICESPIIRFAVMFGRGRKQNGILLDPHPEYAFDPNDSSKLAEFHLTIRPFIEKANAYAPSHSRLVEDLVLVASPSKPFSLTGKGTPKRAVIINEYSKEIEKVYTLLEGEFNLDVHLPIFWSEGEIGQFVDELLSIILEDIIGREKDIFHAGCSSLQAAQIQNAIHRALKEHGFPSNIIPSNFVYLHPTPHSLINALIQVGSDPNTEIAGVENTSVSVLTSLAFKYTEGISLQQSQVSRALPTAKPSVMDGDVVLLTGSTGALGCAMLSALSQDPTVCKVYAINRFHKDGSSLKDRQIQALNERGMDISIIQNPKVTLIEADILAHHLGLSDDLYAELKSTVTRIIHTAWSVRWDIQVTSFEPHIASVRRLVDFALECLTPPLLVFTSSIAVLSNWSEDYPAPELPVNVQQVVGCGGYAESKWVGEQILLHASKTTNLHSIVVRVGQLTGLPNGAWNTSEWVPSIVRSANALGCLPDALGDVSWLPMMSAAHLLASLRHPTHSILHLVHPNPVPWHTVFSSVASILNVPLVPYPIWLAKLESPESKEKVPAARLLSTFRNGNTSLLNKGHEALGAVKLVFANAKECLPGLIEEKVLAEEDFKAWIRYWERHEGRAV